MILCHLKRRQPVKWLTCSRIARIQCESQRPLANLFNVIKAVERPYVQLPKDKLVK